MLVIEQRISKTFGDVTFDQIVMHLSMPREFIPSYVIGHFFKFGWAIQIGVGIILIYCLITILLSFSSLASKLTFFLIYLFYKFRISRICNYDYLFPPRYLLILFTLSLSFFVLSFLKFDRRFQVLEYLSNMNEKTSLLDDYYVSSTLLDYQLQDENGNSISLEKRPNLVIIVAESLETTFSDSILFSENMIHELTDLRESGDYIDNLYMVRGCQYTIASLCALQYGLPLLYFSFVEGNPIQSNIFAKKCISLFDILKANGYLTSHIQGADLHFASHDALYSPICNYKLLGNQEISKVEYPSRQGWGVWDSDLLDLAKKEIQELNNTHKPFALSILTVDTHTGNILQPGHPQKYGDMRDIIRLQSSLLFEFISWVRQSDFGANTVIVLLGDHNMMVNNLGEVDMSGLSSKRRIFNLILNSKSKRQLQKTRMAAVFDFAPTILEALGFQWPSDAFGIGRSLYGNSKTIVEEYGLDKYRKETQKRSDLYMSLIEP